MFEITTLVLSVLVNLGLGATVYLKNAKSLTNRLFFALTFAFGAWSVTNYFSLHPLGLSQLVWIRLVLFWAVFLCLFVYLTFDVFPKYSLSKPSRPHRVAVLVSICMMGLTLTPLVFKRINVANNHVTTIPNFGIGAFAILVICLLGGGIYSILRRYRTAQGKTKTQMLFVLCGLAATFGLIFTTNFLLVNLFHNTSLVPLGPACTLLFTGFFTYAVFKHKLFDIKFFVIRSEAYIISVLLLSLFYIVPAILLVALILKVKLTWWRFGGGVSVALVSAIFYARFRDFFTSITNRVFLRGFYEPQEVLNQLSDLLVRTIDVDYLERQSAKILQSALKTNTFRYCLFSSENKSERERSEFLDSLFKIRQLVNMVSVDESVKNPDVAQKLYDQDITMVVRLHTNRQNLGFITLGYKESGELYTEKDKNLISIVADEIAISLQNALQFRQISEFNLTLQEKVNQATKHLRDSNTKLKALDETKDDFISMASHQLRTPLTSVKGYLSMVLEGDAGRISPVQQKMLNQAFISSQRMVYMIADLLNVSRLKTGKFVIQLTPVDLSKVVQEEVNQLIETAQSREVSLRYVKPENFPVFMLDETKTRQVIMNFMDNAIYYTPAGGKIDVLLSDNHSTIDFKVVDNGIGVPKSEQHHLFTKFYRASNAQKARPDGTGLGLFMAKKVIMVQGGAILFDSQQDKGSTFGFTFSKSRLEAKSVGSVTQIQ